MNGHDKNPFSNDSGMTMQIPADVFQWSLYELHRIKKLQIIQENVENLTCEEITDVNNRLGRMSCFLYQLSSDAGTLQDVYHELKKDDNQKILNRALIYANSLQTATSTGYARYYFSEGEQTDALNNSDSPIGEKLSDRYGNNYSELLFPARNIFNDHLIKYLLESGNISNKIHPVLKYLSKYPTAWNNLEILEYFTNRETGTGLKCSWQDYFVSKIATPYFYNLNDNLPGFYSVPTATPLDAKSDINEYNPRDFLPKHKITSLNQVYAPFMKEIRDSFAHQFSVPIPSDFWYDSITYHSGSDAEKYICLRYLKFTTDVLTIAAEFWFSEKSCDEQVAYLNREKRFEIIPEDIAEWPVSWFENGLLEGISTAEERIVAIKQILSRNSLTDYERFVWTLFLGDAFWLCEDADRTKECYKKAHEVLSHNLDSEEFILNASEGRSQYCFPSWWDHSDYFGKERPKTYTQDDFLEIVSIKKCLSCGNTDDAEQKIITLSESLPERSAEAKAILLNHLSAIAEEMRDERFIISFEKQLYDLQGYVRTLRFKEVNSRLRYNDPKRRSDIFEFGNKYEKAKILIGTCDREYKDGMAEAGRCLYHITQDKQKVCPEICNALHESIVANQQYSCICEPPWSEAYYYVCKVISGDIDSGENILLPVLRKWLSNALRTVDQQKKEQCTDLLEFIAVEIRKKNRESLKESLFPIFDILMEVVQDYYEIIAEASIRASIIPLTEDWFKQKIADAKQEQPKAITSSDPDEILESLSYVNKQRMKDWFSIKRNLHSGLAHLKDYSGKPDAIEEYQKPNQDLADWREHAKEILNAEAESTDPRHRYLIKDALWELDNFKEDTSIYEHIGEIYMNQLDFESAWECFELVAGQSYNPVVLQHLVDLDNYLEDHVRVEAIEGCNDAVLSFKAADNEYFTLCREYSDDNYDFSGPILKYAKGLESLLDEKIWSGVVKEFGSDDTLDGIEGLWWISPALIEGEDRHSFSLGSWDKLIWTNIFQIGNTCKNTPDLIAKICSYLSDNYSTKCLTSIAEACSTIVDDRNDIAHGGVLNKSKLDSIRKEMVVRLNTLIQYLWGSSQKKNKWDRSTKSCDLLFNLGNHCEYKNNPILAVKYYDKYLEIKPWDKNVLLTKSELCEELGNNAKRNHESKHYADYMDMADDAADKRERYLHIHEKISEYRKLKVYKKYGPAQKILDELSTDPIVLEDKLGVSVLNIKSECTDLVKNAEKQLQKGESLLKENHDNLEGLRMQVMPLYQLGHNEEALSVLNRLVKKYENAEEFYISEAEFTYSIPEVWIMWQDRNINSN